MKSIIFGLFLFFSIISNAQLSINPTPVSNNIQITSSQMTIYLTNTSLSSITTNLTVDANAAGISLDTNRCASMLAKQTCYIIISYSNYGKSTSNVSVAFRNNGVLLANLGYTGLNPLPETSNFIVSSIAINDFLNYAVTIKNQTSNTLSYNPILSGTDASKYVFSLASRCLNIPSKGSCTMSVKLNPQQAGSYSATISDSLVTGSILLSSVITSATPGVLPPPVPSLTINPSTISFGTVTRLGQTATQTATVTNNGNVNFTPIISLTGSPLKMSINRCQAVLAPNQSCTVSFSFYVLNTMTNGPQSGLSFNAQATSATAVVSRPVSITLNVPIYLLVQPNTTQTNPTYLYGVLSSGSAMTSHLSPAGDIYQVGGLATYGIGNPSFSLYTPFPSGVKFKYISLEKNGDYLCAISLSNQTYCTDFFGSAWEYYSPDLSGLGGQYFKEVHTGFIEINMCGLTNSNNVYCWGNNDFGQLGDGSSITSGFSFSNIPAPLSMSGILSGKTIKKLETGVITNYVLASDDKVYAWGNGDGGELGNGILANSSSPVAVSMTGSLSGKTVKDLAAGTNAACLISSEDKIYCWGIASATITNQTNINVDLSTPTQVIDTNSVLVGKQFNKMSIGNEHGCAIAKDNAVYCWGGNQYGQLGNGSFGGSRAPVAVDLTPLAGKIPNDISVGGYHTCITTTDSSLFCWGMNEDNQLGITSPNKAIPTLIPKGF